MDARLLGAVDRADALAAAVGARLNPPPASELRVPPGPPRRPGRVLGSLGYYLRFASDPIAFVGERFREYGDLYYAPGPDGHLYGVRHPDHLHEVFVTRAASFDKTHSGFKQLQELLGDGLLTSDGDRWRRRRRMIQPAFEKQRLAGYALAMVDEAGLAAAALRDGEERRVDEDMMRLALAVVSRALFSHDVAGDATDTVARAMHAFKARAESADMAFPWLPTRARARARGAIGELDRLMYAVVDARRAGKSSAPEGRPDLLQMLVTAIDHEGDGAGLTPREVRDELVTMYLAGHETTANALTWTWYYLAKNPEVEAKLHAEIDALGGRPPTLADLERMPYGEQVIKESMRIRPPIFMMARRAREDTEIGGYAVPKGSEIVLWIYWTHHDPRWFPEPDVFRPERFTPENEAKLPKQAFVPFSAGPRACIGKMFAMIEARLLLATIAQRARFELTSDEPAVASPKITLSPQGGMRMRTRLRT